MTGKEKKFKLHSGDLMPVIGYASLFLLLIVTPMLGSICINYGIVFPDFWSIALGRLFVGTARISGEAVKPVLDDALGAGYRLFDTAGSYRNENDIGKALKELLPKHNLTRKDIFVVSKLPNYTDTYGPNAYRALQDSVKQLDLGYIDLYLIHQPAYSPVRQADDKPPTASKDAGPRPKYFGPPPPQENFDFSQARDESWKQLVKGQKEGLVRNLGVSNYNVRHLTQLLNNDHGVKPALNQIEWNLEYHQDDILELCKREGIALQGYRSIGMGNKFLDDEKVKKIAEKLKKTSGQVLLRWAVQQGVLIIPQSRNRKRQEENLNLDFEIPESDMKILSSFEQKPKLHNNPDKII